MNDTIIARLVLVLFTLFIIYGLWPRDLGHDPQPYELGEVIYDNH